MYELEPFLTPVVRNDIFAHLLEASPEEACGYIEIADGEYRYVRSLNIADDKITRVKYTKGDNVIIQTQERVVAFVHTHPAGPGHPTKRDMEVQALVGKPSVIASMDPTNGVVEVFSFGRHLLDLPLNGRPFRYGVTDCYEAIRSWRWQNEQVRMSAFPRRNGWWNEDDTMQPDDLDMYMRHYASQGYVAFEPDFRDPNSKSHPMVGDLLLMRLGPTRDNVINHAGIYVGGNEVYHHRFGKLSGTTPTGYLPSGTVRIWARQGDRL